MKNEKNSVLFKACHALTRESIIGTNYNYNVTFSACLRLYHSNKSGFFASLSAFKVLSRQIISLLDSNDFDFFTACACNDENKIDSLLTFAVNFGLKKRESYASKKDLENMQVNDSATLDNSAPNLVSDMRKQDFHDLKNDVAVYLLSRSENEKFRSIPFVFQLIRAGDCTVTAKYGKICRETKAFGSVASLEELRENGIEYSTSDEYSKLSAFDIANRIIAKLPKCHRETGKKIIELRYTKKSMLIDDIAQELDISVRTVKSIIAEIKAIDIHEITE